MPLEVLYRSAPMAGMNSTRDFHRETTIDLMKEFTICESFSTTDSPYGIMLESPRSYGAMIGDFLTQNGLLKNGSIICEIGGGYGSLMSGLLSEYDGFISRVYMIDLSGKLLKRQLRNLYPWLSRITPIQADIHEIIDALNGIDLIIMNEVLGDLNTMTNIDPAEIPDEALHFIQAYKLEIPEKDFFNLNIGALKLVEAVCRKNTPAFLSEHSSDPIIPEDMDYLKRALALDAYPREIKLYKHSEFTIRFSHLIKIAEAHGKTVRSGALLDLISLSRTPRLRSIFSSRACSTESQEIIYELLDHIREYRWLTIS